MFPKARCPQTKKQTCLLSLPTEIAFVKFLLPRAGRRDAAATTTCRIAPSAAEGGVMRQPMLSEGVWRKLTAGRKDSAGGAVRTRIRALMTRRPQRFWEAESISTMSGKGGKNPQHYLQFVSGGHIIDVSQYDSCRWSSRSCSFCPRCQARRKR